MYSNSLTKKIGKIVEEQNLNCTVEKFQDKIDWNNISKYQRLSEEFIEKFQDKVNWFYISRYQKLSASFSASFIEKFQDKVDWHGISQYQKFSEEFIEKFQDKVGWANVSQYQKLSEEFIEKFQDKVEWFYIPIYQKLSESFIEKFQDKVHWSDISKYQKLSEEFIEKFQYEVDWVYISQYQKLSPQFRNKENLLISEDNWLYKDNEFKLKYIKENTKYEVIDNKYIIAFKGIRSDNYSRINFQYMYEIGKTYEAHCDCNVDNLNSFGLSAWDLENAKRYCDEKIIKVKIAISDLGCIVQDEHKIRCFKFEVIEEL